MDTKHGETSTPINRNYDHCIVTDNGNIYGIIVPNENIVPQGAIIEKIPNDNLNDKQLQLVKKFKPSFNNSFEAFRLKAKEEQVHKTKINIFKSDQYSSK